MIRTCEAGHPPVRLQSDARCVACARRRESSRPSREARGYGREHAAARRALVAMCRERGAVPCAYGCGTLVTADTVVAAHVVDGRPDLGWMPSCARCNERAKHADGGGVGPGTGGRAPHPRPGNPGSARVSAFFVGETWWLRPPATECEPRSGPAPCGYRQVAGRVTERPVGKWTVSGSWHRGRSIGSNRP